VKEIQTKLQR